MTAPSNPSLADARHAAESGELAEWVRDFLGTTSTVLPGPLTNRRSNG